MGITDIDISTELETNAPSIKYRGNEGPKSPQEEQMMRQQMMEQQMMEQEEQMMAPVDYSSRAYRDKLIQQLMDTGGLDYGSAANEADRIIKIKLRPKAAYGGIMGRDGRRQYGIGSFLKKTVRKLIPNEISEIAVKAAPFVAPFNPLAAGLMSGIGSFDQTGKIGSSLKSGLMNYGMGQLARGVGGGTGNLQTGINPFNTSNLGGKALGEGMFSKYLSNPMQSSGGLGGYLSDKAAASGQITNNASIADGMGGNFEVSGGSLKGTGGKNLNSLDRLLDRGEIINRSPISKLGSKIMEYVPTSLSDLNPMSEGFGKKAVGAFGIFKTAQTLLGPPEQVVEDIMKRGDDDFDIVDIRTRVTEAFKDPSGKKLAALRVEFPFLGTQASKNTAMAMGARAGYAVGKKVDYEEDPLYINQDYDEMTVPLTEYEKALRGLKESVKKNLKC